MSIFPSSAMMTPVPESRWTRPRPDCPHPELWTSVDAQSAELEVAGLAAAFVRALQPEYVIETGTCVGATARVLGEALVANGHGRMVSLEIDEAAAAVARQLCEGLPVDIRVQSSMEFLPDRPVGFAWLDSLIDLRIAEFLRFRPWFMPGTVVGFHDTGPHFGSWGRDVERLTGTRCIRLRTPRGVTFAEVL